VRLSLLRSVAHFVISSRQFKLNLYTIIPVAIASACPQFLPIARAMPEAEHVI
jgi:hypothetical protein